MKTIVSSLFIFVMTASASFASNLRCDSQKYTITVNQIEGERPSNYGIDSQMNDAAEVELTQSYFSDRVVAASLKVDGQENKFEVYGVRTSPGTFAGKIFTGKKSYDAICVLQ